MHYLRPILKRRFWGQAAVRLGLLFLLGWDVGNAQVIFERGRPFLRAYGAEPIHGNFRNYTLPSQHGDQYLRRIKKVGTKVISAEEASWDEFGNLTQFRWLEADSVGKLAATIQYRFENELTSQHLVQHSDIYIQNAAFDTIGMIEIAFEYDEGGELRSLVAVSSQGRTLDAYLISKVSETYMTTVYWDKYNDRQSFSKSVAHDSLFACDIHVRRYFDGACADRIYYVPGKSGRLKWLIRTNSRPPNGYTHDYRQIKEANALLDGHAQPYDYGAVMWMAKLSCRIENKRYRLRYYVPGKSGELVYDHTEFVVHH